ncbi:hypothetical protein H0H93_007859 [Arthromyces matolae]|nr:hypothetical protein H0H93_007859 [Arthromyces matolae]
MNKCFSSGRSKKCALYFAFFIFGSLFFFLGGVAYRWGSVDPSDPNVRESVIRKWRREVDRLHRLQKDYHEQANHWQNKSEHFEHDWRSKLEHEERKRAQANLYWGDFKGDPHCASSGRRVYQARLLNFTPSLSAIESCKSTPATINNITYDTPLYCQTKETMSSMDVIGHWEAENEAICSTYWEFFERKANMGIFNLASGDDSDGFYKQDCSAPGSGLRRYEAKFGDVHIGEDPEKLCLSTSVIIHGQLFNRPLACAIRHPNTRDGGRYWGIWDVPVGDCS